MEIGKRYGKGIVTWIWVQPHPSSLERFKGQEQSDWFL
jgi:hypothetical protein